jgi:hypothetical protein
LIGKNTAGQGVYLFEYIAATGLPKTGDAANITAVISKDGAAAVATATANPTEIAGGLYWQPLAQAETNCNALGLAWTSTTSGVVIQPISVLTDRSLVGTSTYAGTDTSGTTTLLGRIPGVVQPQSGDAYLAASSITSNTARTVAIVPDQMPIPSTGSVAYEIDLLLYTLQGQNEAPDSAPTVHARNSVGTSLDAALGSTTMTLISTGHYKVTYTVQSTDAAGEVFFDFTTIVGGVSRVATAVGTVAVSFTVGFNTTDRTNLTGLRTDYTTALATKLSGQNYPANFADLAITPTTGLMSVGVNADKTGYSLSGTQSFNNTGQTLAIPVVVSTTVDANIVSVNNLFTYNGIDWADILLYAAAASLGLTSGMGQGAITFKLYKPGDPITSPHFALITIGPSGDRTAMTPE